MKKNKKIISIISILYMIIMFLLYTNALINTSIPKGIGIIGILVYVIALTLLLNYILVFFIKKELIPKRILTVFIFFYVFSLIAELIDSKFDTDVVIALILFSPIVYIVVKQQILVDKN